MQLDGKDKKLLFLLQNDSKKTTKELASVLDLSVTAVFERIKKLEKQKVIEKYVALIDKQKIQKDFIVLCHVKLVQHRKDYITPVREGNCAVFRGFRMLPCEWRLRLHPENLCERHQGLPGIYGNKTH